MDYCYKIKGITSLEKKRHKIAVEVFGILQDNYQEKIHLQKNDRDYKVEHMVSKKVANQLQSIGIFVFVIDSNSMIPEGVLQDYIEIYHKNKNPDNLNPHLREKWIISKIVDNTAKRMIALFNSYMYPV